MGRLSRWESELWHYISSGDGVHCPLFDGCGIKRGGGWCLSEHTDFYSRIFMTHQNDFKDCDFLDKYCFSRIDTLIKKLARKYLCIGGVTDPPVPTSLIEVFQREYNLEVHVVPLKFFHGAVWNLGSKWLIQIRQQDPSNSQRFTLFHEVFHVLAHTSANKVIFTRGSSEVGTYNEMQAEHFASSILMPRPWIMEMWPQAMDVDKMAEIFQVTRKAMYLTLRWNHLIGNDVH